MTTNKEERHKRFDEIMVGIDKDELEDENGWWETSTGVEFGVKKKQELKSFIDTEVDLAVAEAYQRAVEEERERILRFLPEERNGLTYINDSVREFARQLRELIKLHALKGDEIK